MATTWGAGISFKGAAGSKIYFVTGQPSDTNASAVANDVAFTTDTFQFYQRTSGGWPTSGTSVQGPMGVNGVNGNFYTGTGAPSASLGTSGNSLYIATTGEVWTRASGAAWVDSGESLAGPTGAVGAVGPVGPAGAAGTAGTAGAAGTRGTQIYSGSGAPSATLTSYTPTAVAGDFYFDTTNQIYYVLSGS